MLIFLLIKSSVICLLQELIINYHNHLRLVQLINLLGQYLNQRDISANSRDLEIKQHLHSSYTSYLYTSLLVALNTSFGLRPSVNLSTILATSSISANLAIFLIDCMKLVT